MLTFASLGITTVANPTTLTGTYTGVMSYRYDHVCTNFDHDNSQTSFNGERALLTGQIVGQLFNFTDLVTQLTLGTAPRLTLTVVNSTYDPTLSTASANLTGSITAMAYPEPFDSADKYTSLFAALTFADTVSGSVVFGAMYGSYTAVNPTLSTSANPAASFSMVRGGSCI